MKTLRLFLLMAGLAVLAGCATPTAGLPSAGVLHDELFRPDSRPAEAEQVLALSAEMREYLEQVIRPQVRRVGARQGLLDALYQRNQLKLEYEADYTRSAAEAFAARRGNCMSLVLMTAAFAKALDLPVRYNDVFVESQWRRSGQLDLVSGHVNLTLGYTISERASNAGTRDSLTVDFLPSEDLRGQRSREIEERTILAMYMNNRAAEVLMEGDVDQAYWWARSALLSDSRFLGAFNTLGVIYRRHGRADLAEQVFSKVIALEPANVPALSNLVLTLRNLGRNADAEPLAQRLAQIQPDPPYKYYDLGLAALRVGDFLGAKRQFRRELDRMSYSSELHFLLAMAHYALGELDQAREQLVQAREQSVGEQDRQRYSAKLAALRANAQSATGVARPRQPDRQL
jgi:Flp pilus assembly protein TadD